jgi:hypothetical protein
MKKCPNCNRIYDDSQSFCLEDGSALLTGSTMSSQETIVLPRRKSKFPFILGGLLLLAGALIGGWLLLGLRANESNQNNRQIAVVTQTPVSMPTPTPIVETPTPLPSPSPMPTLSPETNSNVSTNSEMKSETIADSKPADESNPAKQLPVIMKAEDHSILFALHQCRKSGSAITCDFSLTNKGSDRRFKFVIYRSNLYDELGNGYNGKNGQLANQDGGQPSIDFVSGVMTKAQITFEGIEPNAAKITLLRIHYEVGDDSRLDVKFRNVPLIVSK